METQSASKGVINSKMPTNLNTEDCMRLMNNVPASQVPKECENMMQKAHQSGINIIPRRNSAVPLTWNPSEGHGKRTYLFDHDGMDNGPVHVDNVYMTGKSDQEKDKIRMLRTRMSARGALNVPGVDLSAVEQERLKELQKRQSRREEFRSHVNATTTAAN